MQLKADEVKGLTLMHPVILVQPLLSRSSLPMEQSVQIEVLSQ
jgi:hypothetical protein